jgi:hypothetical protein
VFWRTRRNKATIRRWIDEAWNKGNVDIADEIYDSEFVARDHEDPNEVISTPYGIKSSVKKFKRANPGVCLVILDLIAEGDKVVGVFLVKGMKDEEGRFAEYRAMDVWKFDKRGMIVARTHAAPLARLS